MVHHLKSLGLTELEAKCYLYLNENPNQTGYEVSKNIGVSRSNVYACLSSLTQKGITRAIEGKSTVYSAVAIEEVLDQLTQAFNHSAQILTESLKSVPKVEYQFYSATNEKEVLAMIERSISHSKKSIVADLWPEDFKILQTALENAQRKGVKVVINTFEKPDTTILNLIVDERITNDQDISDFSILCDDKKAILGSIDSSIENSAIETHHPAVVQMLKSAYEHDIIIEHLVHNHSEFFKQHYPKGLSQIIKDFNNRLK